MEYGLRHIGSRSARYGTDALASSWHRVRDMTEKVALVPGFWGSAVDYFVSGFASRLGELTGLEVVPMTVGPTASLADRQLALVRQLDRSHRWHVVGHSAGGLDAAMLLRTHALAWRCGRSEFSIATLDAPVCSAITISAPHHGTGLAREITLLHVLEAAVGALAAPERELAERLRFALAGLRAGGGLRREPLAVDLRPENCGVLTDTPNRRAGVPLYSIATIAPSRAGAELLFRMLARWTAHGSRRDARKQMQVGAFPRVIGALEQHVVADRDSDGVVNTLRQLDGEVRALVVGDHADVIGHYGRDALLSGAHFGGEQLDQMLQTIAACISGARREAA